MWKIWRESSPLRRVKLAFIGSTILSAPIWALYSLLILIVYKDLGATPLQITLLLSAKPTAALLSFYWSSLLNRRPDRIKSNLQCAFWIGGIASALLPLCAGHYSLLLLAFALFMASSRAEIPAWMELLKQHLSEKERSRLVSTGTLIRYGTALFLPLLVGTWMDYYPPIWRLLFPLLGLLSLLAILLQQLIPKSLSSVGLPAEALSCRVDLPNLLVNPWRRCWQLLRERVDFATFQLIFFLGGLGLMVMQPALPIFFVDTLDISYAQAALALAGCKGLGFAMTTRIWARYLPSANIYGFCALITALATLFPLLILTAYSANWWIYCGYTVYGIMQGGSELCWNLSGPIFSRREDSSTYTGVNIVLVGIRGCIGPILGGILCTISGPVVALFIGSLSCALATTVALYARRAPFAALIREG